MVQVQCLDPRTNEDYNFLYCPSFPAAVLFSALFGLTTFAHVVQAVRYRKKFCWVVIMAGSWETGGLVLRLLILLAPLWINAFLYVLMACLVYFFVPEKHVGGISARRLSLCFVLLDITAFLAQAGGGSIISSDSPRVALTGIHIYMGGIGLQQLFIFAFTALIRIVFRLIEFSLGLFSAITMHEAPFYCLPMFVALLLWNIFHPGQVLVGPESEFPKKVKGSKKVKREKDAEEHSLRALVPPH
ncbi:hypothetical protein FB451DRAFT_1342275 [Mycena latifolia]|nr:hypothetical protein FB451DRAFT_1342275 [Mycena latifolia]